MDRKSFVARFGHVFEHSPWIAERAFDTGGVPQPISAGSLHAALCRAFRAATETEQQGVIDAHPDLAGKLAAAGELTADSTAEQQSAGLDMMTTEERRRFTELNDAYRQRFGFPFIMAVKGKSRQEIEAAFERRLQHDRQTEFETALAQIETIALLRLQEILP